LIRYTGGTSDDTEEIEFTSDRLRLAPAFLLEGSNVEVRQKAKAGKWREAIVVKNLHGNMTVRYVGMRAGANEVVSWASDRLRRAGPVRGCAGQGQTLDCFNRALIEH
jgi:hypothetical protein